jgi:curved DNA-binding protein CbpA
VVGNAVDKAGCFTVLLLSPDATLKEARMAYMRLVKRWHPDRFADNPQMRESAQEKLKVINSAYEEVTALIVARIERGSRKSFSKPASSAPERTSEDRRPDSAKPLPPRTIFSAVRNTISNRVRRFFSSAPTAAPQQAPERRGRPKAPVPSGEKGEEKNFQKIFDDAVRSKTGRPYRPLKRARRPIDRSEKDPKVRAQNAVYRPIHSRRKAGEPAARVEPVSKIKGV